MIKLSRKIYPFYFFLDLVVIGLIFYSTYILRFNSLDNVATGLYLPSFQSHSFIFIIWAIFITIFFKRRNLYMTDRGLSIPKEIYKVILSIFYASLLVFFVIFFAKYKFFSRAVIIESIILLCFCLSGWRIVKKLILRKLIAKGYHNVNILIVGAGNIGAAVLKEVKMNPYWGFKVVGFLDDNKDIDMDGVKVLGPLSACSSIVKQHFVEEVIVTIPSERKAVSSLIKEVRNMRLGLRIAPENFEEPLPVLNVSYLGMIPLLTYKERKRHPAELALKRFLDFFLSVIFLIVLAPLFLAIALIIKIDSKGPVFYIDKRVGLKNNSFNFFKFRSMIMDAKLMKSDLLDKNQVKDGVIFKILDDPRITKAGKFLRKYSLDELPQLFNVIKGDMGLVGPRPPLEEEVKKYSFDHMQRLSIRPGMTGLSQVKARTELSFKKWVRMDIWYMNHWAFGFDAKILWWTVIAVLQGKGV